MKPVVQHWTGRSSRPAPGVAGAMKICLKHEQGHRVTEPCPYCDDRPKAPGPLTPFGQEREDVEVRGILSWYPRVQLYSGKHSILWGIDPRAYAWLECPPEERYAHKTRAVESCVIHCSGPLASGHELQFSCALTGRQTVFALDHLTRATIVAWWKDL